MSFAVSVVSNVPTVTQSGTDTSWAGIDTMVTGVATVAISTAYAIGDVRKPPAFNSFWYRCTTAGTTAASPPLYGTANGGTTTDGTAVFTAFLAPFSVVMGDLKQYNCQDCRYNGTGTLTILNPGRESPTFLTFATSSAAIYTSGVFAVDGVTPKTSGIHFVALKKGSNNYAELETWDGIWAIRGGSIILGGAVRPDGSGSKIFTGVNIVAAADWGAGQSIRWRSYATAMRLRQCRTYDVGIDCFNIPLEVDVKGFGSEYVAQYVGSQFGGIDALLAMSALSNADGTYDFDNYSGGWVEISNCVKGAALNVVCQQNVARHCVPLFQALNFTVTNLQGATQNGVKFTCTDAPVSNSPTVTITTQGSLKTWDFRNPLTYTGTTAGGGLATSTPALKVWHGATNLQNLRFPASTATYRFCGYTLRQLDKAIVLGSDTAQAIGVAGEAATNLSLSEATAAALTGIALAPSGATGGTATITVARDVLELWQYFRAWKPNNFASDDTWLPSSPALSLGAWNLTCSSVVLSASGLFNTINTTGTFTATLAAGGAYTYVSGSLVLPLSAPMVTAGTMNIGAAGTYNFSTVGTIVSMTPVAASSYTITGTHTGTLSLKNTSAFAITVTIPAGTTYTTAANVGGAITVQFPDVGIAVTGLIAGSTIQIYNTTDSVELYCAVVAGTSYTHNLQYVSNKALRLRASKQSGVTAYTPFETIGTLTSSGASFTANQVASSVYNTWAIDGSLQTQYTADGPNVDIDITAGGSYTKKSLAAWWMYYLTTVAGLRAFWGTYTLESVTSIRQDITVVDVLLQNTATGTTVTFTDNDVRYYRSDFSIPYDTTPGFGSIFMDYAGVPLLPGNLASTTAAAVWNSTVASYPTTGTFGLSSAQTRTLAGLIPAAL